MIVEPMAGDTPGAQSQPGRPAVLCGLDHDLRADLAVAGGRCGARRTGRREKLREVITVRRIHNRAARHGNAVQHDP